MSDDPEDFDDDDIDDEPVGPATQIGLICAILEYLGKTDDCRSPNTRQQNAVIAAANDIMAQLRWADVPATPGMGFEAWRVSDDTGMSSRYLATALMNGRTAGASAEELSLRHYPLDPSDFGRCVRMLDAVPGLRERLPAAMADPAHGPVWNALAGRWAELEAMYTAALPSRDGAALYDAMKACGC